MDIPDDNMTTQQQELQVFKPIEKGLTLANEIQHDLHTRVVQGLSTRLRISIATKWFTGLTGQFLQHHNPQQLRLSPCSTHLSNFEDKPTLAMPHATTTKIPPVPQLLNECFEAFREPWVHGFMFTTEAIHIPHLTRPSFLNTALIGNIRVSHSHPSTDGTCVPENNPMSSLNARYFFAPAMTIYPITVGFGVAHTRLILPTEIGVTFPRDLYTPFRFLVNDATDTICFVYDDEQMQTVTLVLRRRHGNQSMETRTTFQRAKFREAASTDPSLSVAAFLPLLIYFVTTDSTSVCKVCYKPDKDARSAGVHIDVCDCVCGSACEAANGVVLEPKLEQMTKPRHPFDLRSFSSAWRKRNSLLLGTTTHVTFSDGFPGLCFDSESTTCVQTVSDRSVISKLRQIVLQRHAHSLQEDARTDASLLLPVPPLENADTGCDMDEFDISEMMANDKGWVVEKKRRKAASHELERQNYVQNDLLESPISVDGAEAVPTIMTRASTDRLFDSLIQPLLQSDGFELETVRDVQVAAITPAAVLSNGDMVDNGAVHTDSTSSSGAIVANDKVTGMRSKEGADAAVVDQITSSGNSSRESGIRTIAAVDTACTERNVSTSEPSPLHPENTATSAPKAVLLNSDEGTHTSTMRSAAQTVGNANAVQGPSEHMTRRMVVLEMRRERNRAAARRSNARVKAFREGLLQQLRDERVRIDTLRLREVQLRSENLKLRKQVHSSI